MELEWIAICSSSRYNVNTCAAVRSGGKVSRDGRKESGLAFHVYGGVGEALKALTAEKGEPGHGGRREGAYFLLLSGDVISGIR